MCALSGSALRFPAAAFEVQLAGEVRLAARNLGTNTATVQGSSPLRLYEIDRPRRFLSPTHCNTPSIAYGLLRRSASSTMRQASLIEPLIVSRLPT